MGFDQADLPDPVVKPFRSRSLGRALGMLSDCLGALALIFGEQPRPMESSPMSRTADSPLDRPASWSRRHRTALVATAAAFVSFAITAAMAASLITSAQRQTRRALDAQTQALAAQRLATVKMAAALAAETQTKERMRIVFGKASKTVEDFVTLIRDDRQLRETPALRPFREALLRRALAFSQGFIKDYETVPDLRIEVAEANLKAAILTQETGRPLDAEPSYRKALFTYESLVAERPEVDGYREGLAKACTGLGRLQSDTGRPAEAERSYGRARELFERLVAERPEAAAYREGLSKTCLALGDLLKATGRAEEAERIYGRGRALGKGPR